MNPREHFRKTEERTFFAHHMLLHAAECAISEASASKVGRFNKCLAAIVFSSLAVEALANAAGSRIAANWPDFERKKPYEKIEHLVAQLSIARDTTKEPWTTLRYLGGFRNAIAHPKPEEILIEMVLPQAGLDKTAFNKPLSSMEKEVTLGNAKKAHFAVKTLKRLLAEAMPEETRFGIDVDMWHGSTTAA
jgi:hypothetical protein